MRKRQSVYLAILNHGRIRREMYYMLDRMRNTDEVDVYLENLRLSWASPIFSNRNKITKRFLLHEPKCDWLMMIDDDVVPFDNPMELFQAINIEDHDIIGVPAKVRQAGRSLNWVAYLKHPEREAYAPLDFGLIDSDDDMVKVAVIGSGLIIVHRRVLEALKSPWTIEVDEDGICEFGTDFAFCRKATAAGFKVYTTPWRRCEHYKEVGLTEMSGYDDCDYHNTASNKYKMAWGDWAIGQKDWAFMESVIDRLKPKSILEFGAGLSSLLMSEKTKVMTLDTSTKYAEEIRGKATDENDLQIEIWDGKNLVGPGLGQFDLIFIDGPPGKATGGIGREHSFRFAAEHSDKIIVHDAGRHEEQLLQNFFLRPDFKLTGSSGQYHSRCHLWERKA